MKDPAQLSYSLNISVLRKNMRSNNKTLNLLLMAARAHDITFEGIVLIRLDYSTHDLTYYLFGIELAFNT